jgi:hypothetical protein
MNTVRLIVLVLGLPGLLVSSAVRSRAGDDDKVSAEAKRQWRVDTPKNLRELGIAMHNYHNDYRELPPAAITGADGKPLLSWRVAILPYLSEAELYKAFRLNEAWDSAHNKKLIEKMPAIFAPVGIKSKQPHTTYYQVLTGPGAAFEPGLRLTLARLSVGDGTSNTFMIVEGTDSVPWTKPVDITFKADKPLPRLDGPFQAGFHACYGDCAVRYVKKTIPEGLLRQLIGWNDGLNQDTSEYIE